MAITKGTWNFFGLPTPDIGFSERLLRGRTNSPLLINPNQTITQVQGITAPEQYSQPAGPQSTVDPYRDAQSRQNFPNPTLPQPTTSGQAAAPSGNFNLNAGPQLGLTSAATDAARRAIESQSGLLDQSYNLSRGDLENTQAEAIAAGQKQKASNEKSYGNLLRQVNQTYSDVNKQRLNSAAARNAIDSSEYGVGVAQASQSQAEQALETQRQRQIADEGVDTEVNSFKSQVSAQLGQLALQYQQGKNAIQQALANNDIQGAAAIQNVIQDIQNRAVALTSQGQKVIGGLPNINMNTYGGNLNTALTGTLASAERQFAQPQQEQVAGFIGPDGKRYQSYADFLRSQNQSIALA